MSEPTGLAPFASTHSDDFPAILAALGSSLVLTTYQSGKLALLSPTDNGITQLLRTFDNPMGCAIDGERMAVACRNEVVLLYDSPIAGAAYPRKPNTYDAFFLPRSAHFTGPLDIHDMAWTAAGVPVFVNTRFSCLATLGSGRHSFEVAWRPPFVKTMVPDDQCHLNGLAMEDGQPRFVTALASTSQARGWRNHKLDGGVIIDVPSGEIVVRGLAMPHSPRLIENRLFVLNSALAQLLCIDPDTGNSDVVAELPGFARGMARLGDYLFIGLSEVRRRNQTFGDLPLAERSNLYCGVVALHLPTGTLAGFFRYLMSCKEIYDLQVLPGRLRPGILGVEDSRHHDQITAADNVWWAQTEA